MTVGGSSASVIQAGGSTANRIHLADYGSGGSVIRTFDVADATGDSAADLIVSAALINGRGDGAAVGLTKTGPGTMTLTGTNTYTGGTTVNGGTLSLSSNGGNCAIKGVLTVNAGGTVVTTGDGTGLGTNGGQSVPTLNINGGTVTSAGTMHIWSTMTGGVNMTGGTLRSNNGVSDPNGGQLEWGNAALNTLASSQTATIAGRIRIRQETSSGLVFTVAGGPASPDLLVSAAITDNGNANIIKAGSGSMNLTGVNTYTGSTTVNGGTLRSTNEWSLSTTSGIFINNGGTLSLTSHNTLGGDVNPRAVTIANGGRLTMEGNYSVNIGTLTLNGGELSSGGFSDPVYGSYKLRTDVTVGAGTSTISAVNVVSAIPRTFNVASGGTLNVTGTLSSVDGSLGVIKAGPGTMVLVGANTYTGDTVVNGGSLAVNGTSIADTNRLIIDGGTVNLTGAERVGSLFFGAVEQAPGAYSATGAGGTIASNRFTGTGTLFVGISNYDYWASGLPSGQQGATADPDKDGMANLLEYVLNGNPFVSDPAILLDTAITATDYEFTYSRYYYSLDDTVQTFEYSTNLTSWMTANIPMGPGVNIQVGPAKVTITDMGVTDTVTISVPRSVGVGGKLFGRLRVAKTTPHQVTADGPANTYTNAGKAYMGWHSTYAQQYSYGGVTYYMTEQFVKSQTDWMASNFLSYGYQWICIDGWGTATRHNADGYISTQSDSWVGGWTEMAAYVHSKGMKFGMYFSPAWIHMHIANNLNNKIKGTNLTIKSITREDKTHQNVYLVDTTRPGAKQFVQGMVQYFISCGVDLLKVDFMREYEVAYGHAQMVTLMEWMREAAGNQLIVTLCLPIGYNHLQDERRYGDNIRVTGDYLEDLWYHTSKDTRGIVRDFAWPMSSNVYDGLSWSSDITGQAKFIASPDYVTFHNSGSNDERKFAMSIRIISGAAVEFGDSYSDISGDANANFLRNSELTALNAEGFFAKPLTMTLADARNQIWADQTANGDRIVALFNREDSAQVRSVNFQNDLGLAGSHNVRDLWTHQHVGFMSSYSTTVPAHGVVVLRIYVFNVPPANGDPNPPPALIGVPVTSGTYTLINKRSGHALNIPSGATANGVQLIQWPWNLTFQANEKWRITIVGTGLYNIVNNSSNKCATVAGASLASGAAIVQSDYTGAASDKWQMLDSGGGYYRIINQNSGKCLTVQGASTASGANIIQSTYTAGDSDLWQIHITP